MSMWQPKLCNSCAAVIERQAAAVPEGTETTGGIFCNHGARPVYATARLRTRSVECLSIRGPTSETEAAILQASLARVIAAADPEARDVSDVSRLQ